MKFRLSILTLLTFFSLSSFNFHPMAMAVGDITQTNNKLHLKFKFFTDNIEPILISRCKLTQAPENNGYNSNTAKCLQAYIASKFQMSINGAPVKWVYKSSSLDPDVLIISYEYPYNVKKIKSIKIKNTLLFEDFPEMKNIMNINLLNQMKMLEYDNQEIANSGKAIQEIKY